jgi:5-methylcytosine-specific restriction endonuclease McrA
MSYISNALRLLVAHRAAFRCEYCRIPDLGFAIPFQVDHIRSLKHDGATGLSNLAYCCPDCNRYKGTDLGSYLTDETTLIRFFNPRIDIWDEHFKVENAIIFAKTPSGQVTVTIFQFNSVARVIYRKELLESDLY